MRPQVSPTAPAVDAGAATVVFIRPSSWGMAYMPTIVDANTRGFLGDSLRETRFVVRLQPGEHTFVAADLKVAGRSRAMKASLQGGKIYLVEVGLKMDAADLFAISPRTRQWPRVRDWLSQTRQLEPDRARGQSYLQEKNEELQEAIQAAQERFGEFDAEHLVKVTLRPSDGLDRLP